MHRSLVVLLAILVFLAACQQAQPPAPTLDTSLATPAANAVPSSTPAIRELVTGQPQIIPGTIIPPATEDPLAGTPFDRILFTRSGGIAGQTLTIEIRGDGTVIRDGVTSQISPEQVQQITDILDRMNFFGLQGVFTAPGTGADVYQYSVTVERQGASRTIDAQDGLTPAQLMALITALSEIGATP
ncbi:MAG: hypothetical protein HZC41_00425 [Chloroflexi bacterium]|nr:hypothetical protein [Chloroflexota bacterium]